jgi:hypothetical protein
MGFVHNWIGRNKDDQAEGCLETGYQILLLLSLVGLLGQMAGPSETVTRLVTVYKIVATPNTQISATTNVHNSMACLTVIWISNHDDSKVKVVGAHC